MRGAWAQLVQRYAGPRKVCNCGQAYYHTNGTYWRGGNYGQEFHDGDFCRHGCQANQYAVKDEIAEAVLAELRLLNAVDLPEEKDIDRYVPYGG